MCLQLVLHLLPGSFAPKKSYVTKFEQQMDQSNVFNLDYKTLFFFLNKANCLSLKCYECGRVLRTLPDHTPNAARLSRQLKKQTTVLTIHFPVLVKSNVQPVVVSTIRVKTVPQHAQVNNKTEICPLRCWFESVHFFFFLLLITLFSQIQLSGGSANK